MRRRGSEPAANAPAADGEAGTGRRLRLRPGLTVIPGAPGDPGVMWVRINARVLRLRGGGVRAVLELIDGTRTLEDVCRDAGAPGSPEIAALVERFRRHGFLEPELNADHEEGPPGTSAGTAPLLRALMDQGAEAAAVATELREGRVAILGTGCLGDAVRSALERCGMTHLGTYPAERAGSPELEREIVEADVAVVAPDAGDPEWIEWFNAVALRGRLPWLLVAVDGFDLRLGPFILPGETACYVCHARRLDANSTAFAQQAAVRDAVRRGGVRVAPPDNLVPGVALLAGELCAFEVARFFAGRVSAVAPALHDHFVDYSLTSHRAAPHRVLKLPRCPACGARASGHPTIRAWMDPDDDLTGGA